MTVEPPSLTPKRDVLPMSARTGSKIEAWLAPRLASAGRPRLLARPALCRRHSRPRAAERPARAGLPDGLAPALHPRGRPPGPRAQAQGREPRQGRDPLDHRQPPLDHLALDAAGRPPRPHPPHVPRRARRASSTRSSATSRAATAARASSSATTSRPTAPVSRVAARAPSRSSRRGAHHDLLAIFNELNARYFDGACHALITWGKKQPRRSEAPRKAIRLGSYIEPRAPHPHPPGARSQVGAAVLRRVRRLPRDAPPHDPGGPREHALGSRQPRQPRARLGEGRAVAARPSPAGVSRARAAVPQVRPRAPVGAPAHHPPPA